MRFYSEITHDILVAIRREVGESAVINEPERLRDYSKDATNDRFMPEVVVEPERVEQIQALLRLANRFNFPVTPRGLGTGLAGGCLPHLGGVVLSLARMNRLIEVNPANLYAIVEPGVINLDLRRTAQAHGLFYPPDPASLDISSLGGNAATDAGGPACVKYGTTKHYVLGLEAVLPSGELVATGTYTRKGVVGYDLARLLVGSEGTLGVITRLILKLIPLPPATASMIAIFPDLGQAMQGVSDIMAAGFSPSALEFMDWRCLELVGDLLPCAIPKGDGALLLIETDGATESVRTDILGIGEVCRRAGAMHIQPADDAADRERMWWVRRQVSLRIQEASGVYLPEDVAVPIGRIAEVIRLLPPVESRYGVRLYAFGHAGDGNIHVSLSAPKGTSTEVVHNAVRDVLAEVVAMRGTISGEHGVGIAKKPFLDLELSGTVLELQRRIKRVFDPNMILNPGKIFD